MHKNIKLNTKVIIIIQTIIKFKDYKGSIGTSKKTTEISRCEESQLTEIEAPHHGDQVLQIGDQELQISYLAPQKELAGQD